MERLLQADALIVFAVRNLDHCAIGSVAAIFPTAERETRAIIAPIETIQLHTDPFQQFFFRGREEIRSNNQPGLFRTKSNCRIRPTRAHRLSPQRRGILPVTSSVLSRTRPLASRLAGSYTGDPAMWMVLRVGSPQNSPRIGPAKSRLLSSAGRSMKKCEAAVCSAIPLQEISACRR